MARIGRTVRGGFEGCLVGLALLFPYTAAAQVCNSTGADGALTMTTAGTFDFDPVAAGLNASGDNVFHFTSITIGPGVRLRLRASKMKSPGPVVFLASGAVTIDGAISVAGASGHNNVTDFSLRSPSEPGPGGYPGGAGGKPGDVGQAGAGPGGGGTRSGLVKHGCPAAFAAPPALGPNLNSDGSSNACPVTTYGNVFLQPLVGGSGGSGGTVTTGSSSAGGGGAGGGAIRVCSDASITIRTPLQLEAISANGGNAGSGGGASIAGGPGSGGAIHLQAPVVNIAASSRIEAVGGVAAATQDRASSGRIRIDANNTVNVALVNPVPAVGPFRAAPLPQPSTARVIRVQGVNVTANPANNPAAPDVSVSASGPVAIEVETTNVPDGTAARFFISTGAGTADLAQNATVSGNRATLNVVLPLGVHRLLVRVSF